MVDHVAAKASPEKRLFISLITRDISLIEAFLDIIDNSINAALEPLAAELRTADDYQRLLGNSKMKAKLDVEVTVQATKIIVEDNAHGISLRTAVEHVFKFGRSESDTASRDRLSVYGIGLKRAMFKCGNSIEIISDHKGGGFELDLDVRSWEKIKAEPWTFEVSPRKAAKVNLGTKITITDLHEDVRRRISDGLFLNQLRERIARTYSFFIGRVVNITVNSVPIEKISFEIGSNYVSEKFKSGSVSCSVTAGIAVTDGEAFRERNSGWFVFCNGRAVLFADKSLLTGWGGGGLPIFQPKHRPFLGTVFFVSPDPESLPWTTTKGTVNEDDIGWQEAKRRMVSVGRVITGFLDKRYTDEGTEIGPSELQGASGQRLNALEAATSKARSFKPPTKPGPKQVKVQYSANVADVNKIEAYLRQPGMGGSKVGRYTFDFFLKNEVGGK
jgi:hypothetical protein